MCDVSLFSLLTFCVVCHLYVYWSAQLRIAGARPPGFLHVITNELARRDAASPPAKRIIVWKSSAYLAYNPEALGRKQSIDYEAQEPPGPGQ